MRVAELMTPNPTIIGPADSVQRAAELLARSQVGALPVCEGERLVGLVTGRDIADRAAGAAPARLRVAEVMTGDVRFATPEDDPRAAGLLMSDLDVGRLPVVDAEKNLVGIVSRRDLAGLDEESAADDIVAAV